MEKKGAILTLLTLIGKEGVKVSILYSYLKIDFGTGTSTFYSALITLRNLGLIEETFVEDPRGGPKRRIISLSSKGLKVAKKLLEIGEILSK